MKLDSSQSEILAKKIVDYRCDNKLTRYQFANQIGVKELYIELYENPTWDNYDREILIMIAKGMNITFEELTGKKPIKKLSKEDFQLIRIALIELEASLYNNASLNFDEYIKNRKKELIERSESIIDLIDNIY